MADLSCEVTAIEYPLPEGEPCKGLVFRGYVNKFASGGHIGNHQGVKLLKRKSCPGCKHCGYTLEQISETITDGVLIMSEIVHGALYSARITNISTDWETGYVDDYDVEIYKMDEEPKP